MTVGKQCADVHTNILAQMICERWLATADLGAHFARLQEIYRRKCALMLDCIDREFSPRVAHTTPEGGLFLWCTLPEGADMMDFCNRAVAEKVAVVPGHRLPREGDRPLPQLPHELLHPHRRGDRRGVQTPRQADPRALRLRR